MVKNRLIVLVKCYLFFILLFVVQKPIFMLYHWEKSSQASIGEWFAVIWHGLPMDLSTAGYFTLIPALLLIVSVWIKNNVITTIVNVYSIVVLFVITVICLVDMELYSHWGFRIDTTPLFYIQSPKDALASMSGWMIIVGLLALVAGFSSIYILFRRFVLSAFRLLPNNRIYQAKSTLYLTLITALLFLPIRGGVSVATMNVGTAYFSNNIFLNHSAINPFFNLMASVLSEKNFAKQYRFMDDAKAHQLFSAMQEKPVAADSIPEVLNEKRPNIIFFVLESFMSNDIEALGGLPVAQNLSRFCDESIVFTNMYANSFRTDRGLIANLSGYPAQPTASIMQFPTKSQSLPSIQKSLKQAGYSTSYYYGGDADFTKMRSYLMSSGIEHLVADKDFPIKQRLSKWGVPDHLLLRRVLSDLQQPSKQPFISIVQTLSSHEPFEVPMHRFSDPYLNSVAYTDSCLGVFIQELKKMPLWKNTLLVFVPDHAMLYPATLENSSPKRYSIPLIWGGGAIKAPMKVKRLGSQIDIAATLLYQLGIPHTDFKFSKNMFNPASPAFGFFAYVDGFGIVTPNATVVYDNSVQKIIHGDAQSAALEQGKAFLQCLYDDLAKR